MSRRDYKFTVLIIPQSGYWIAQCLEYDIMAQGQSIEEVEERWKETLYSHVRVASKLEKRPFEGIGQAPPEYWELHDRKDREVDPISALNIPPDIAEHLPSNAQAIFA